VGTRLRSVDEIKGEIRKAFAGVKLDGGISLNQTKVIDNYGRECSEDEFNALPLSEVTDDWTKVSSKALDEAECLAFLDDLGFRYYIPALMCRLLDNYDSGSMMSIGTLRGLYPDSEYYRQRYAKLSEPQSVAIAKFVQFLPNHISLDTEDKTIVERAFQKYWLKFLEDIRK
jgi:hypothetical protein